jgi:hypothetical protein
MGDWNWSGNGRAFCEPGLAREGDQKAALYAFRDSFFLTEPPRCWYGLKF